MRPPHRSPAATTTRAYAGSHINPNATRWGGPRSSSSATWRCAAGATDPAASRPLSPRPGVQRGTKQPTVVKRRGENGRSDRSACTSVAGAPARRRAARLSMSSERAIDENERARRASVGAGGECRRPASGVQQEPLSGGERFGGEPAVACGVGAPREPVVRPAADEAVVGRRAPVVGGTFVLNRQSAQYSVAAGAKRAAGRQQRVDARRCTHLRIIADDRGPALSAPILTS